MKSSVPDLGLMLTTVVALTKYLTTNSEDTNLIIIIISNSERSWMMK